MRRGLLALWLAVLWLAAGAALAQDQPESPIETWEAVAERAETTIEAARASTEAFENLREELTGWREEFLQAQSINASRIETVQAQIAALGPPPEAETDTEDERIAARRAVLEAQLARLRAPVILAEEAHTQADGLIAEIDGIVRARQAERLASRGQSPLVPAGWPRAWEALRDSLLLTRAELVASYNTPALRAAAGQALPQVLVFLSLALVLVLRGRRWTAVLGQRLTARTRRGRGVLAFVLSLGQVVLPLAGLVALYAAAEATGLLGRRTEALMAALPFVGLYPVIAHWLAGQLLPLRETGRLPVVSLALPPDAHRRAHRLFVALGYALALRVLLEIVVISNGINEASRGVLAFPIGLIIAWLIFALGRALLHSGVDLEGEAEGTASEPPPGQGFRVGSTQLVGRALILIAALGTVLAALGYTAAFELAIFPSAATLYVLGTLLVLQRLAFDLYGLLTGAAEGETDALIPVLIGFLLVLAALPVLALVWGARVADLTELWARFQEGFAIGETRISPSDFLTFALVFVIGYAVVRLLQGALRSTVLPKTRLDIGGRNAVVVGVGYVGIFLAAVIAITTAGIDLSGLAIVAGALSVGIGFGLQNIVSNFVSGIILLIERPISEGDWIEVNGQMGYVRAISVRSTRIETFDRTDVIVPNADLVSGQVTNYTRGNSVGRLILPVGVAYGTDTRKVEAVLQGIAEAHPMVLLNPAPYVFFSGFGDSSLDFEIRAILRDVNFILSVKTEMNHQIAEAFAKEGIEIPFPQRDLWVRNPEDLRGPSEEGT